jgi:RNA polymerase sigma-70 factor, ECF subfamily
MTAQADAQLAELFRRDAGKICAWLVRLLGPARLELIEDAVQDAFGAALAQWPYEGTPRNPAGWLAVAARNKALDGLKRDSRLDAIDPADEAAAWRLGFSDPEDAGRSDDTLALMFVACHPALGPDEQVMLTLQAVCGFNPREIGRAFLSNPDAVTQRLVRAKRKLKKLQPAFEIPEGGELAERSGALRHVIYLLFTGGYAATEGANLLRDDLCAEALRLARLLAQHPRTATGETHALLALMCFQHARAAARVGDTGDLVLLAAQDRSRWDVDLLGEGFANLRAAMRARRLTPLHLEAGIAALHASAPSFEQTDWPALRRSYDHLLELKHSPVVKVNAAIARAYADGPAAGLEQLTGLGDQAKLQNYAPFHAARGDLLKKLKRYIEAADAFSSALKCPLNAVEREHLLSEVQQCRAASGDRSQLN